MVKANVILPESEVTPARALSPSKLVRKVSMSPFILLLSGGCGVLFRVQAEGPFDFVDESIIIVQVICLCLHLCTEPIEGISTEVRTEESTLLSIGVKRLGIRALSLYLSSSPPVRNKATYWFFAPKLTYRGLASSLSLPI